MYLKFFLRPLRTCASPGWFPFFSVATLTKLERLHRAASRAITGCFAFLFHIPLLFSSAFQNERLLSEQNYNRSSGFKVIFVIGAVDRSVIDLLHHQSGCTEQQCFYLCILCIVFSNHTKQKSSLPRFPNLS